MNNWLRRALALPAMVALVALALAVPSAAPASAVVDDDNPTATWRPANGVVYAMARVGDMIVVGGTFTAMRSPDGATTVTRNRVAAISATTGDLLPWNPAPNGDVRAVAGSPDGATVYVGGAFTTIAGASRSRTAAVSASTGQVTPFVANVPTGLVRGLRMIGDRLFVVGDFGKINGVERWNGAEVNPTTGAVGQWNPRANKGINVVAAAADGSGIYIGGFFTTVDGQAREFAAKTDFTTGKVQPWLSGSSCSDASNPCYVYEIHPTGDTVYLGQGGPGGRVVALDPVSGAQRWWTGADGDITSIQTQNGKVYVAGHFDSSFAGQPRAGIAVLNQATGAVLPDFDALVVGGAGVWQILLDGDVLRASGQFTSVGSKSIGKYTAFAVLPDPPDTQAPAKPGTFRVPAALADNVSMSWAPAADDVATIRYRIYRDGLQIGTSSTTSYKDRTVSPATGYTYTVDAVDAAGNASPQATPVTVTTEALTPTLLGRGAVWHFLSMGEAPADGWTALGFAETGWAVGRGEFGYGDADEDTPISPRGVAHYFRTTFEVADTGTVGSATMRLLLDDGAVVYLNGQEVGRVNMPTGTITNTATAVNGIGGTAEMTYQALDLPVALLRSGTNQLAVSVHNQSSSSSDVSFDAFVQYVPQDPPAAP